MITRNRSCSCELPAAYEHKKVDADINSAHFMQVVTVPGKVSLTDSVGATFRLQ